MVMVAGTFGFVPHLNFCHKCIVHSLVYQDSKYRGRVSDNSVKRLRGERNLLVETQVCPALRNLLAIQPAT